MASSLGDAAAALTTRRAGAGLEAKSSVWMAIQWIITTAQRAGYTGPTVNTLRHRLPACTWIVALAMLAMALLPGVSHALAHARGDNTAWVEVCTPQGMRLVALPAADALAPDSPAPLQTAGHLEHCALCALAQDTLSLPAAPPLPARLATTDVPRSQPLLRAPCAAPAWPSAQPRAPPARV